MTKSHSVLPVFAGAFLIFSGCGDDVTKTTVNETGISQLAKGAEFPDCDSSAVGEMLYAADSGKVYYCGANGKWETLNGVDGESSVDTVVVLDTVLQKDTLVQKDSVFFSQIDTLIIRDTLVGLNGESCTAEMLGDSSGYKIVCGGDSVGVVRNGSDGKDGIDGAAGKNGESCTVADSGNGVVTVQCASDTVKLYKALCGNEPFDPAESFCYKDSVVTLCGGEVYDLAKNFCYNDGAKDSVVSLCGGDSYDLSKFTCTDDALYVTDSRDNQKYRVVTIGEQIWMAENLNYAYDEGTAKSYCYENSADSCAKYGRLYTWAAAMDSAAVFSTNGSGCGYGTTCSATMPVRGVCPEGWHLPDSTEWNALFTAVGGSSTAGKFLKATSGWYYDGNGTDSYGFSALPAGYGYSDGDSFYSTCKNAYFWSVSEYSALSARDMYFYSGDDVTQNYNLKDFAYSVRCLSD